MGTSGFCFVSGRTGTHHADLASLELTVVFLPWSPHRWVYRHMPPCLTMTVIAKKPPQGPSISLGGPKLGGESCQVGRALSGPGRQALSWPEVVRPCASQNLSPKMPPQHAEVRSEFEASLVYMFLGYQGCCWSQQSAMRREVLGTGDKVSPAPPQAKAPG